jgi:hypothetical protein
MSTNNWNPSPTTAPAEAPEIKSIQELQTKKSDALAFLHDKSDFSEADKISLAAEFETALSDLMSKKAAEKDRDIGDFMKTELEKLRTNMHNEKKDTNEALDDVDSDTVWSTDSEKKLHLAEIRWQLDEFKISIENQLNLPAAEEAPPTPSPEPAEAIEDFLPELDIPEEIPAIPSDYVSKNKPSWFESLIINILEKIGLSSVANWLTMRTMGYKSERQMKYTRDSMNNMLAIKESPISSIIRLDDITEREFREILGNHNDIDLSIPENVEAAFLGKHANNPKYKKYHRIYKGIEDMAGTISGAWEGNYNPIERLDELLWYSKKTEFDPEYPEKEDTTALIAATATPEEEASESEETAPEITTPLKDVLARYDGRPYEEQQESASKDTIFTFAQDDIFLSIKRWDQKEIANINENGTLTYRGITGTPEMIIQLARLDMYMVSFKWSLELADNNNLTGENKIEKFYNDLDGQWVNNRIVTASINEIPSFLQGWDWQKLYTFLLRDEAQKIAPAEAAQMSGEKPEGIIQEDLDIILGRTDVKETTEDAKFSGKIEEDGSITITRAPADGEQKWDESIFPNTDGTYTIGNVQFPNITDAIKAANMRNWVRWHEENGNELHQDGANIQVDDSTSRLISGKFIMPRERFRSDTNLIEDWKIPEFLTHGTLPETGNNITSLEEVYSFLKGAVIDDGIYGKNKTRAKWEETEYMK